MKQTAKEKVNFIQAIKQFIKGYFDFRGTSTRASFWWLQLGIVLSYGLLFIITGIFSANRKFYESPINPFMSTLIVLFTLFLVIPKIALTIRRLRDTGLKSKTILSFVIFYGALYVMYMMTMYYKILSLFPYAWEFEDSYYPSMLNMGGSDSALVMFSFILLSVFLNISMVLATDTYATKSDNKILLSMFKKLE